MSKYFSVKYLLISKKTGTLVQTVQKIHFWGVYLGVPWGGVYLLIMSKLLALKYLLISEKNCHPRLTRSKNSFLGVPGGVVSPNHVKIFLF